MNNQPCTNNTNTISLKPDELSYYPFINSLARCGGRCNTVEDRFARICVANKIEV